MRKSLICFIAGSLLTNLAFAANSDTANAITLTQPQGSHFDGRPSLYVGAQFGLGLTSIKRTVDYVTFDYPQHETDNYTLNGVNGGFYLGGGLVLERIYLGGELAAGFSNLQRQVTHNNFTYKQSQQTNWSADFVPGFFVKPNCLVYAKVGATKSTFKFTTNQPVEFRSDNLSQSATGIRLGFGARTYITHKISVNLEYVMTNYSSFEHTFTDTTVIPTTPYDNKFSVTTHQFNLGVAYDIV